MCIRDSSFIAQLRRADVDGAFVWTSPAGQVVDVLAGGAAPEPPRARRGAENDSRSTERTTRAPAKATRGAEKSAPATERNARSRKGR